MNGGESTYRYAIEHFTRDGRSLGQALVLPDFQPAREWAYFAAVRRGELPLVTAPACGEVVPIWCDDLGPPHCSGVRVLGTDFPSDYFRDAARQKARDYAKEGGDAGDAPALFRVHAYPCGSPPQAEPDPLGFGVETIPEPIAIGARELAERIASSEAAGAADPLDVPVFVEGAILRDVCALAEAAGALETGGVLVGRLERDPHSDEIFVDVTAQIPARQGEASESSFAFTPETWAAAHAALELRGSGELIVGWWHAHPYFCRSCPEDRRPACRFSRPFFSGDDVHLHRTCFPQAWQQALLVSERPDGERIPALFGWRMGRVTQRGFWRLRATEEGRCRG